jgi:hypothetical protein
MANARAIANGNWSSTSTWNGGTLPGNGDTVYSNGFTVTIDQNVTIGDTNNPTINAGSFVAGQYYQITFVGTTSFTTIGASANTVGTIFLSTGLGSGTGTAKALATLTTLTNTAAGATTGGGGFTMSTAYNVNADLRGGPSHCLTYSATTGTSTINNTNIIGGSSANIYGLLVSSTATATINTANVQSSSGSVSSGIVLSGNGTINLSNAFISANNATAIANSSSSGTINIISCTNSGTGINGISVVNSSTGTINISNSTVSGNSGAVGYSNTSTGTVTITGSTLTAGSGGAALNNTSTGTINCSTCTFTASTGANAVSSTNASADVRLSGSFYDAVNGYKAVYSPKWRLAVTPLAARTRYALDGSSTYVDMFTADNTGIAPAVGDVRFGVVYGSATGTCRVPAAASVAAGVLVDVSSTGTAVLTASAIWDTLTSSMTTSGSIGERLKNAATVATTGAQISSALS